MMPTMRTSEELRDLTSDCGSWRIRWGACSSSRSLSTEAVATWTSYCGFSTVPATDTPTTSTSLCDTAGVAQVWLRARLNRRARVIDPAE